MTNTNKMINNTDNTINNTDNTVNDSLSVDNSLSVNDSLPANNSNTDNNSSTDNDSSTANESIYELCPAHKKLSESGLVEFRNRKLYGWDGFQSDMPEKLDVATNGDYYIDGIRYESSKMESEALNILDMMCCEDAWLLDTLYLSRDAFNPDIELTDDQCGEILYYFETCEEWGEAIHNLIEYSDIGFLIDDILDGTIVVKSLTEYIDEYIESIAPSDYYEVKEFYNSLSDYIDCCDIEEFVNGLLDSNEYIIEDFPENAVVSFGW